MAHLKRQKVPKNWPIPRKGSTYVVRPNLNINKGIPILIILRDLLKIVQNRKEAKKAIHAKNILHNNKIIKDEKNSVSLLDIITIVPLKTHYRVELSEFGKFSLEKIKEDEAKHKIVKVIDKKVLRGKKTQLNLSDGRNFISSLKCKTNDSVLINLKEKKIEKCIPLKEKAKVIVFAGKHSGNKGLIEKIDLKRKMVKVVNERKRINVLIKQLMVIE